MVEEEGKKTLSERINEEMSVDYQTTLEKNFEVAKKYVRITSKGTVDVLKKDLMAGKDRVALYLIGKHYAKEGGKANTKMVDINELAEELGAPKGSIYPWLKRLRDKNVLASEKREKNKTVYSIKINHVEKILNKIDGDLNKQG